VPVNVANGNQVLSAGHGTILIRSLVEDKWSNLRLINVLHVPSLDRNLFSTRKIVEKGCKMIGDAKTIKFEKNGRIVMMVMVMIIRDDVFVLLIEVRNSESCRPAQVEVRAGSLRD